MFIDEIFRRVMKLIWWRSELSFENKMLIWSWIQNYRIDEEKRKEENEKKTKKKTKKMKCWFDHEFKVIELTKSVKLIWWRSKLSFEEKMLIWSLTQDYRIDEKEEEKENWNNWSIKLSLENSIDCLNNRLKCFYSIH